MSKIHNFNAGPSILPQEVFTKASEAVLEYEDTGLSILEMSHRSDEVVALINKAESLVMELLDLPESFTPLFLTGGASTQFMMHSLNFLSPNETAGIIDTGRWSQKTIKETKLFGNVEVLASSRDEKYNFIPKEYQIPDKIKYLHVTSNNTIAGTQYKAFPDCDCPLVADMSSDIFSRKLDVSKFGLIYAGAQKNMGPAGVTLVIVNREVLQKASREIPTILDYETHIKKHSAFNTPPVFPIYVSKLVLQWIKENGGVSVIEKANEEKASTLYKEIDTNPLFKGVVATEDRSLMNVTFKLTKEAMEQEFIDFATERGIIGIKGHRSVGGLRASIYNAMPKESIEVLVSTMHEFAESRA